MTSIRSLGLSSKTLWTVKNPQNEKSVGFICQILRYLEVPYSLELPHAVLSHSGIKNYPVVSFNFSLEQLLAEVMFPVESRERDQKCHQWNGNSVVRKKKDRSSCSTDTTSLIFLAWNKSQRKWRKNICKNKSMHNKEEREEPVPCCCRSAENLLHWSLPELPVNPSVSVTAYLLHFIIRLDSFLILVNFDYNNFD